MGDRTYLATFRNIRDIPLMTRPFPRSLISLHQIEITSRCNLRCVYCPSPHLARQKVDMSWEHFERAMEWVAHYCDQGTQGEVNLAGIGESTLHPEFARMVRRAREVVGPNRVVIFATNGVGVTEALLDEIAPAHPHVWVSLHRPEKAGPVVHWLKARGMLAGVSADPALNSSNWAGQVEWQHTQVEVSACMWLRRGMAMALADGRITTCCYDANGSGVVGHLEDPIGSVLLEPYDLCTGCTQVIATEGHAQWPEGKCPLPQEQL